MENVESIREKFKDLYKAQRYCDNGTFELTGVSFRATEPVIFGYPNEKYIDAEIRWYQSRSRNVNRLFEMYGKEVQIWKNVADNGGQINSNYGWCVYDEQNYEQFNNVYNELRTDKNSRRAIMIYTRPSMHYDCNVNGMSDFMCTNSVQYLIRDGYLQAIVNMRSNDAVFGYINDYAWQRLVSKRLSLGIKCNAWSYYMAGWKSTCISTSF